MDVCLLLTFSLKLQLSCSDLTIKRHDGTAEDPLRLQQESVCTRLLEPLLPAISIASFPSDPAQLRNKPSQNSFMFWQITEWDK